jgi:hypothetical protein
MFFILITYFIKEYAITNTITKLVPIINLSFNKKQNLNLYYYYFLNPTNKVMKPFSKDY